MLNKIDPPQPLELTPSEPIHGPGHQTILQWSGCFQPIERARINRTLSASHYMVLTALVDMAIHGSIDLTFANIAMYAGCSPRTVQRALAHLQEDRSLRLLFGARYDQPLPQPELSQSREDSMP